MAFFIPSSVERKSYTFSGATPIAMTAGSSAPSTLFRRYDRVPGNFFTSQKSAQELGAPGVPGSPYLSVFHAKTVANTSEPTQ